MLRSLQADQGLLSRTVAGRTARNIVFHYLMTNIGLFGLMSTLAVSLTADRFSAAQTGLLILIFTIATKSAKVPLAPWLDKLSVPSSVLLGCLTAASGFVVLRFVSGLALTALALALAGLGMSINSLATKQLAADASDRAGSRARLFSMTNIAVNIASAVAAPAALFFVNRHHDGYVLTAVAVLYCTAGVTTFLNYSGIRLERNASASLSGYLAVLKLPGMRSFLLVSFLGWFCYGQLFNALAIYVSSGLKEPGKLGWLYTLNALLIVVTQLRVTRMTESWTRERHIITAVLSYLTFALSFIVIYAVPGYAGAVLAVVVFTVAEMMFVPTMDVLLLGVLGGESRSMGYGIFSLSDAVGESAGGGIGVAVYRWLSDSGHGHDFWLITATLAVAATAITYRLREAPGLNSGAPGPEVMAGTAQVVPDKG